MAEQHFIFLLKEKTVTPQSLEEASAAEVICEMLRQQFYISRIHVLADSNQKALDKFMKISRHHQSELSAETIIC